MKSCKRDFNRSKIIFRNRITRGLDNNAAFMRLKFGIILPEGNNVLTEGPISRSIRNVLEL